MLRDAAISGDRIVIRKEAEKIPKHKKRPYNRNTAHMECRNRKVYQ